MVRAAVRLLLARRDMFCSRRQRERAERDVRLEAALECIDDAYVISNHVTCEVTRRGRRIPVGQARAHSFQYPFSMVPRPQSSAAGVLALLVEQEPLVKQHALKTLISLVPQFWAEISEHIALMYVLQISSPYSSLYLTEMQRISL
jgi:hypothetical protein